MIGKASQLLQVMHERAQLCRRLGDSPSWLVRVLTISPATQLDSTGRYKLGAAYAQDLTEPAGRQRLDVVSNPSNR